MPKIPRGLSQDAIIRALIRAGGSEVKGRGKGSHRSVDMPDKAKAVTVPRHPRVGTVASILREAGLTVEEFLDLL
jgi:predicted RNA binding protein YcfA (HicA-like mRNA interferase family)